MFSPSVYPSGRRTLAGLSAGLMFLLASASVPVQAQEGAMTPHWIWRAADKSVGDVAAETVWLRKSFQVKEPSRLVLDVTADNSYELFLDGKKIGDGSDWQVVKSVDVKIAVGAHALAAVATNAEPGPAGFLLRGGIMPLGQGVPIHTNRTWRATEKAPQGDAWKLAGFDDSKWPHVADFGPLGQGPWTGISFTSGDVAERFKVPEGFVVTTVASADVTGSGVSFAFDDRGAPCVGVERGPIVRLIDANHDGKYEDKQVITPQMKNCQGFFFDVALDGKNVFLWAVGDGPKGTGIHKLADQNQDGVYETVLHYVRTDGMGEHGPHAIARGPDGMLYYNNGNHAHIREPVIDAKSPVDENFRYEGELLPHYNDARGHAAGIMAPGGEILRSRDDGKTWERVVAGFRNEYDFAFNRAGELFSFDSDMEWDVGLPWYRPVRVCFCPPGAEFGWRNGAAKWPSYYFDSLPSVLNVGRGSPTGVTFYQASAFPAEYHDHFLICDWSQGRILAIALKRSGASYTAKETELVTGRPLNCTDIEVGPDGAVYFTTGGRGTNGGLFRVFPKDPNAEKPPADPIDRAIAIDSPLSAFSRSALIEIKHGLGEAWSSKLEAIAQDGKAQAARRIRALDLLQQLGPKPSESTLVSLTRDADAHVRAHAVLLLGSHADEATRTALTAALSDQDPFVRRRACEAFVQARLAAPVDKILPILADPDRFLRYAARIALEHGDPASARSAILSSTSNRAKLVGLLALVRTTKLDALTQNDMLTRELGLFREKLSAEEKLDLIRLVGLTYLLGPRKTAEPAECESLHAALVNESAECLDFDGARALTRERLRLLAYINDPDAVALLTKEMASPKSDKGDQILFANCLRVIRSGWNGETKKAYWNWFETASHWDGGFSFLGYLDFMIQDFLPRLSEQDQAVLLADAAKTPFPSRILVRGLDVDAHPESIQRLQAIYTGLESSNNPNAANELRSLIVEKLGRSNRLEAKTALRALVQAYADRRDLFARALAAKPTAEDLPILVAALESRDPNTTNNILAALRSLKESPQGPEALRNLILLARRSGPTFAGELDALGRKWTGAAASTARDFKGILAHWDKVYSEKFPNGPSLVENASAQRTYTLAQLDAELIRSGLLKNGSPERGKVVLKKARCLDCHKFGNEGQGLGPDLTTVNSRFRPIEILESIVDPSKVLSDQYKPIVVATVDGKIYNGMPAGNDAKNLVLLLSDATKVTIPKADIDEQKESKVSVMPEGLLAPLSLQEIADLIAMFEAAPRVEQPAKN